MCPKQCFAYFSDMLKGAFDRESMAGSVIQATETVEFWDGLRMGVLPEFRAWVVLNYSSYVVLG